MAKVGVAEFETPYSGSATGACFIFSMLEEMSNEEAKLAEKLAVTKAKTMELKKDVAKRKNKLAAIRKVQFVMGA